MYKKVKKTLAMIMAVAMLAAILPLTASANASVFTDIQIKGVELQELSSLTAAVPFNHTSFQAWTTGTTESMTAITGATVVANVPPHVASVSGDVITFVGGSGDAAARFLTTAEDTALRTSSTATTDNTSRHRD
jgi:hypothetical protein